MMLLFEMKEGINMDFQFIANAVAAVKGHTGLVLRILKLDTIVLAKKSLNIKSATSITIMSEVENDKCGECDGVIEAIEIGHIKIE